MSAASASARLPKSFGGEDFAPPLRDRRPQRQDRLKALNKRISHANVAFTVKQYVQIDLEADREVANTLADLIIAGLLVTGIEDHAHASNRADEA